MSDSSHTGTAAASEQLAGINKDEIGREDNTPSSIESTPDPTAEIIAQDPAQPQKRKGGRKPVSLFPPST